MYYIEYYHTNGFYYLHNFHNMSYKYSQCFQLSINSFTINLWKMKYSLSYLNK